MGVKIKLDNIKIYKGEKISDIIIKSSKNLKSINCPSRLNSGAIDEFLIIFLIAARAKGVSYFKDIGESIAIFKIFFRLIINFLNLLLFLRNLEKKFLLSFCRVLSILHQMIMPQ